MTVGALGWNRFAGVSRPVAVVVLSLLALLMVWGATGGVGRDYVAVAKPTSAQFDGLVGDHALYARIAQRVDAGESYYAAAAAEHRVGDYPLRPFVAVRLPTLAYIVATLGEQKAMIFLLAVGGTAILGWYRRLRTESTLPRYAAVGALFVAANLTQLAAREWLFIHEVAAGILLALALALYRPARPWWTMAIVAAALAIRETVLPVAMLFGTFALIDRDWRAAAGWLAIGLCFAAGLAAHIAALAAVTTPVDAASQGWNGQGGWIAYLSFIQASSLLRFFTGWVGALLVPLALLGWAAWRARLGLVVLLIQFGYAALLMLFARPANFYWAMLVTPTLFIGLAFAPAALTALVRSLARPKRAIPASAI
ncbi:Putative membrane protein [Sphingopyxis fribergensis]|uniref:Putative membrane protein n=2 Tax=Sphingopyxis fribergensis TaxID=1515612 RepID=A0A0A7PU03_9SPHN|nr:Putative membrane protein [Sphingopyxis fribergensis]